MLVAAGALLYSVLERRDVPERALAGGDFGLCKQRKGDDARACYTREVARELAAVKAAAPDVTLVAPAGSGEITFASLDADAAQSQPLLCDLHARVGVIDEQVPSWLGWTEPLAEAAPSS